LIYIFAPLGDPNKRTRLVKFIESYRVKSLAVKFIGWAREPNEKSNFNCDTHHILSGGGYGANARKYYPIWMIMVFYNALKLPKESVVHALGWESAFPVLLSSIFKKHKIIFDDADRFSLIIRLPGVLKRMLQKLEKLTSKYVDVHIIPSLSRYSWEYDNMLVIRNTPTSWDVQPILDNSLSNSEDSLLTVYINGWVGHSRGAPIFYKVFSRLEREGHNIKVNFAGRVDSEEGRKLLKLTNVVNWGELTQKEALRLYALSNVVITYYDPSIKINTKAESNKWGDSVVFNTPFIVNSEVLTAKKFVDVGCAWSVEYDNHIGLYELLIDIANNPDLLVNARESFKAIDEEYMAFEQRVYELISKVVE
jgi:glycosyltransferase involved in cell wall biosynthesis